MKNRCKTPRARHERKMKKAVTRASGGGAPNRSKVKHHNRRSRHSCSSWR